MDSGRGPWYVATLKNLLNDTVMTYVHSYAFKVASVMNVLHPKDCWVVLRLVGPFDDLDEALRQQPSHDVYEWVAESEEYVETRFSPPQRVKMKDLK